VINFSAASWTWWVWQSTKCTLLENYLLYDSLIHCCNDQSKAFCLVNCPDYKQCRDSTKIIPRRLSHQLQLKKPKSPKSTCTVWSHLSPNFRLDRNGMESCSLFEELGIIRSLAYITCLNILIHISPERLPIKPFSNFLLSFIPPKVTTCKNQ
jgi:hypothetical protein